MVSIHKFFVVIKLKKQGYILIRLVTGIDDIGTMNAKSEGWTFLSFDEQYLENFNDKAQDILNRSKLKSFHGKEFKRNKNIYYEEFLFLIRSVIASDKNSFICCTLSDESWKNDFSSFCSSVISTSFNKASIEDSKFVEAAAKLAQPMYIYSRIFPQYPSAVLTRIDIDRDSILSRINTDKLIVNGSEISKDTPIFSAFNAYSAKQFPNAPKIERQSIRVLNDESSFLIQAADMIGNFSTAFVAKLLGKDSKTNNLKANCFEKVFGDFLDTSNVSKMVELIDDEVVLKQEGAFNFTIAYE